MSSCLDILHVLKVVQTAAHSSLKVTSETSLSAAKFLFQLGLFSMIFFYNRALPAGGVRSRALPCPAMHDFVAEEAAGQCTTSWPTKHCTSQCRHVSVNVQRWSCHKKEGICIYPFPRPRLPSSTSTPQRQDDRWTEGQDKIRVAVLE